jgi:hypothetical protein
MTTHRWMHDGDHAAFEAGETRYLAAKEAR